MLRLILLLIIAQSANPLEPMRTITIPPPQNTFSSMLPKWANGYLVQITNRDYLGQWPVLSLYDHDGKLLIKERPVIPENATELVVTSATVTQQGTVFIAGKMSGYAGQPQFVILSVSRGEVLPA